MTVDDEFGHDDTTVTLSEDRQRALEEFGRHAGAALRSPAPAQGAAAIARRVRNQRIIRVGGATAGVIVLLVVGAVVFTRGDDSGVQHPTDTATDRSVPATTVGSTPTTAQPATTVEPTSSTTASAQSVRPAAVTITPTEAAQSAKFMPDGRVLVDLGNNLMIWDVANGTQLHNFGEMSSSAGDTPPIVSPDGTKVLYHDVLWDTTSGDRIVSNGGPFGPFEPWAYLSPFSPDSATVIMINIPPSSLHRGAIETHDTTSGQITLTLTAPDDRNLWYASFSPDGTKIATSGIAIPRVWDVATGAELLHIDDDDGWQVVTTFSPDSRKIVSAVPLGTTDPHAATPYSVRVRDAATADLLYEISPIETDNPDGDSFGPDLTTFFSPDGGRLLIAPKSGDVSIVDAETGRRVTTIGPVASDWWSKAGPAVFSPDGTKIVTVSGSTATVWDTATGQLLRILDGHTSQTVSTASFSPDGSQIVTTSGAAGVTVWNLSQQ